MLERVGEMKHILSDTRQIRLKRQLDLSEDSSSKSKQQPHVEPESGFHTRVSNTKSQNSADTSLQRKPMVVDQVAQSDSGVSTQSNTMLVNVTSIDPQKMSEADSTNPCVGCRTLSFNQSGKDKGAIPKVRRTQMGNYEPRSSRSKPTTPTSHCTNIDYKPSHEQNVDFILQRRNQFSDAIASNQKECHPMDSQSESDTDQLTLHPLALGKPIFKVGSELMNVVPDYMSDDDDEIVVKDNAVPIEGISSNSNGTGTTNSDQTTMKTLLSDNTNPMINDHAHAPHGADCPHSSTESLPEHTDDETSLKTIQSDSTNPLLSEQDNFNLDFPLPRHHCPQAEPLPELDLGATCTETPSCMERASAVRQKPVANVTPIRRPNLVAESLRTQREDQQQPGGVGRLVGGTNYSVGVLDQHEHDDTAVRIASGTQLSRQLVTHIHDASTNMLDMVGIVMRLMSDGEQEREIVQTLLPLLEQGMQDMVRNPEMVAQVCQLFARLGIGEFVQHRTECIILDIKPKNIDSLKKLLQNYYCRILHQELNNLFLFNKIKEMAHKKGANVELQIEIQVDMLLDIVLKADPMFILTQLFDSPVEGCLNDIWFTYCEHFNLWFWTPYSDGSLWFQVQKHEVDEGLFCGLKPRVDYLALLRHLEKEVPKPPEDFLQFPCIICDSDEGECTLSKSVSNSISRDDSTTSFSSPDDHKNSKWVFDRSYSQMSTSSGDSFAC